MNVMISISYSDICNRLFLLTAQAELQRGDEKLVATEDNADVLQDFVKQGVPMLDAAVKLYGGAAIENNGVALSLEMPSNWPNCTAQLEEAAEAFLVAFALGAWYAQAGVSYDGGAASYIAAISDILNRRKKPL